MRPLSFILSPLRGARTNSRLGATVAVLAIAFLIPTFDRPARAQDTPGEAQAGGQLTKPPKLQKFVPAVYPKDKHDAGVTAQVTLSIEIDDTGKVGNVEVVGSGGADFDAAAVAAVKQFTFEPAEIDNVPAPVKIT